MKRRLRLVIPVLLVIALIGFVLWRLFGPHETGLPNTITGNGVMEATEVDVSAKVAGKVLSLRAREGDSVVAGQLLATLDSGELRGQVEQSAGNLAATEAVYADTVAGTRPEELRRLQAQYEAAQDALTQATAQRDLIKAGTRTEVIAQLRANYNQAQAQLQLVQAGPRAEERAQLRAAYEQAQQQLSLVQAGPRAEEIGQLRAALQQAKVTLDDAETELARKEKLFAQGAVAQQTVDTARTRRAVAQTGVDAAQQRLAEAQNGARPQELKQAQAAVEIARQRLEEAEHGARPQEVQAAQEAVEAARQQLMEAQAGPRPQERTQAEAAVAAAQAQTRAARAALDLAIAGPTKETIAAAKARVDQARGGLVTSDASASQTRIYAPTDGRVTLRNVEPGELVTPGLPILRVAEIATVWIRVYVPEEQIGRIKVGQRAAVTTDAFGARRFAGRVIEIAEQAEFTPKNVQTKEERVKQVFGVKIEVQNPDGVLKPGMPGDAVIYVR